MTSQPDESDIEMVVHRFYERVRADEVLGPLFNDAIGDWPLHLDKLCAFWSSVMLTTGRYKGQPVPAHRKHADRIDPAMFDRWLALWAQTTSELLERPAARAMQEKANRIAESLKLALFFKLPSVIHEPAAPANGHDRLATQGA
ncbi:group III truncated hemoglobin [Altericroceibacterium endophyticum]|uniref:Preprotein translocase subunit TatC n=1 Tax=Altericroceibacterium endophyticum TaxID=1808508 RepID=A0A6I4TA08_9SPHN|nr:group III truncated hemoglobin [Altericroceibacterium endophyticum]MXO67132.1 preprotein translocase subunit TatC [Altericroceibacterium endophyticum]